MATAKIRTSSPNDVLLMPHNSPELPNSACVTPKRQSQLCLNVPKGVQPKNTTQSDRVCRVIPQFPNLLPGTRKVESTCLLNFQSSQMGSVENWKKWGFTPYDDDEQSVTSEDGDNDDPCLSNKENISQIGINRLNQIPEIEQHQLGDDQSKQKLNQRQKLTPAQMHGERRDNKPVLDGQQGPMAKSFEDYGGGSNATYRLYQGLQKQASKNNQEYGRQHSNQSPRQHKLQLNRHKQSIERPIGQSSVRTSDNMCSKQTNLANLDSYKCEASRKAKLVSVEQDGGRSPNQINSLHQRTPVCQSSRDGLRQSQQQSPAHYCSPLDVSHALPDYSRSKLSNQTHSQTQHPQGQAQQSPLIHQNNHQRSQHSIVQTRVAQRDGEGVSQARQFPSEHQAGYDVTKTPVPSCGKTMETKTKEGIKTGNKTTYCSKKSISTCVQIGEDEHVDLTKRKLTELGQDEALGDGYESNQRATKRRALADVTDKGSSPNNVNIQNGRVSSSGVSHAIAPCHNRNQRSDYDEPSSFRRGGSVEGKLSYEQAGFVQDAQNQEKQPLENSQRGLLSKCDGDGCENENSYRVNKPQRGLFHRNTACGPSIGECNESIEQQEENKRVRLQQDNQLSVSQRLRAYGASERQHSKSAMKAGQQPIARLHGSPFYHQKLGLACRQKLNLAASSNNPDLQRQDVDIPKQLLVKNSQQHAEHGFSERPRGLPAHAIRQDNNGQAPQRKQTCEPQINQRRNPNIDAFAKSMGKYRGTDSSSLNSGTPVVPTQDYRKVCRSLQYTEQSRGQVAQQLPPKVDTATRASTPVAPSQHYAAAQQSSLKKSGSSSQPLPNLVKWKGLDVTPCVLKYLEQSRGQKIQTEQKKAQNYFHGQKDKRELLSDVNYAVGTLKVLFEAQRHLIIAGILSHGGSCIVYKVVDAHSRSTQPSLYALKAVKLAGVDAHMKQKFLQEKDILQQLRSEKGVIKLYDWSNDGKVMHLLMQLGDGSVQDSITREHDKEGFLSKQYILTVWTNMVKALAPVHKHRYVHLDLKPANFVVAAQLNLLVIDFGIAAKEEEEKGYVQRFERMGTLQYMAPETVNRVQNQSYCQFSTAADIWSLGIILYQLVHNTTPWKNKQNASLIAEVKAGKFCLEPDAPIEFNALIKLCCQKEARNRPTVEELLDMLRVTFQDVDLDECDLPHGEDTFIRQLDSQRDHRSQCNATMQPSSIVQQEQSVNFSAQDQIIIEPKGLNRAHRASTSHSKIKQGKFNSVFDHLARSNPQTQKRNRRRL